MKQERTVLVAGYYGFGNLGDELLRLALAQGLPRSVTPLFLVAQPPGVGEVDRADPRSVLAALRRSFALLFGGGGLLQNRTSVRSLYYYLSLVLLARLARRPVFLLGQGIGPIRGRLARAATRFALAKACYIGCRDAGSLSLVRSMGRAAVLDGDLFFLFPPLDGCDGAPAGERPRVALALKGPHPLARRALSERMVTLLHGLHARTDASFTLLVSFPAEDLPFAEELAKTSGVPCRIASPATLAEVTEELACADLLIASRLHAVEAALRTGTPILAVPEDPKIERLLAEVRSLGGLKIPSSPLPSVEEALSVLGFPPSYRVALRAAYHRLHERTREAFSSFLAQLEAILGGSDA